MIIYSCEDFPPGNGTLFSNNQLKDGNGDAIDGATWTPKIRHSGCGQAVKMEDNGDVLLEYFSDK